MRPLAHLVAATLASCVLSSSMEGQWAVGAEVGAARFWGGSIETTERPRSFRPYRPTTFGVRLHRVGPAFGVGLGLGYFQAGLALEGPGARSVADGVFTAYSVAAELFYRIATLGSGNRLILRGGPLLEVWKALDENAETRLGIDGALSLWVPLTGRLEGTVSAGGALMPSPFAEDQLDPDFERRSLWRRSFVLGLQYGL